MFHEEFLQFVWQHQYFNRKDLKTEDGEELQIVKAGLLNSNAGPDFFNGQVRIDNILWVGNIEVHLRSSDWYRHQHQTDHSYSKVILHVVWEHDAEVITEFERQIPVLSLKGRVKKKLIDQYASIQNDTNWIPCESSITSIEPIHIHQMLDRTIIERLQLKSERVEQLLAVHKNDWEQVCFQLIARCFGMKVNADAFELLAISIPIKLIRKYQADPFKMEALFFGQAGMLTEVINDEYHKQLRKEYALIQRLHKVIPLDSSIWKYLRLRPNNFPCIRISQLANLYSKHTKVFSRLRSCDELKKIHSLLDLQATDYWSYHYVFAKARKGRVVYKIGKALRDSIIINAIVPLMYSWLTYNGKTDHSSILELLKKLKAEDNKLVRKWESLGLKVHSAYDSQAVLQLHSEHCELKKCLTCTIGNAVIKLDP